MALLKPPPDRSEWDKGALEGEGKERYLNSLERRLNRLQGTDKRKITSKDIMASLSEAKESHIMQPRDLSFTGSLETQTSGHSSSGQPTSATRPMLEPEPAHNDPWSAPQTGNSHQAETIDNSSDNCQHSSEEEQQPDEFFVDVQLKKSGCGFMSCLTSCTACVRRRGSTGRWRLRRSSGGGSSLTAGEERAYLMQCDQLGLGKDEDDDIWSTD